MNSYVRALLGLGNSGAVANARRACERRLDDTARLEARLAEIMADRPAVMPVARPAARPGAAALPRSA